MHVFFNAWHQINLFRYLCLQTRDTQTQQCKHYHIKAFYLNILKVFYYDQYTKKKKQQKNMAKLDPHLNWTRKCKISHKMETPVNPTTQHINCSLQGCPLYGVVDVDLAVLRVGLKDLGAGHVVIN